MSDLALWFISGSLMLTGLLGIFVPGLPGIALVFAGILVYGWATAFVSISLVTVVVFGVVALFAWLLEYLGGIIGVKAGGGSWQAIVGMIIGGLVGLMAGGPIALIVGIFLGTMMGAMMAGAGAQDASRTALYSLIGMVGAKIVQFGLAVGMILAFLAALAI